MDRFTKHSLLVIAATVAATTAFAAKSHMENDAKALPATAMSLAKAIGVAEQHTAGQATRAEYEMTKQGWLVDVEIVNGKQVFDVKIDANKGTVVAQTEDRADKEGDGEDEAD